MTFLSNRKVCSTRVQSINTFLILSLLTLTGNRNAVAEEVRMHGAVTVVDLCVAPNKAAVESATSLTITAVGNSAGKGMSDLLDGKCEAALMAGDLNAAIDAAKKGGKDPEVGKLVYSLLMQDEIVIVVNPANPVKKLTASQVKDILTGKITNWKDVGGNDSGIVVVAEVPTGATRAAIKGMLLDNQEYAGATKVQPTVKQIPQQIAEFKSGIGGVSRTIAEKYKVQIVELDKKLERPLGVVTVGEPAGNTKKAIEALQAELAKTK